MKSVRDFLAGKLRRAETTSLTLALDGPPHPALGAFEATLESARGRVDFYARGLLSGEHTLAYADIERVELSPLEGALRLVDVRTAAGTARLACSDEGGRVIHAALRWVGHTLLRRRIAD